MNILDIHKNRLKKSLEMLETDDVATLMGCASTRINRLTEEKKALEQRISDLESELNAKLAHHCKGN